MIFIKMHDSFMSNWGRAEGKNNIYQIACDSLDQAKIIVNNVKKRPEMKNIRIDSSSSKDDEKTLVTKINFADLGPIWKE